MKLLSETLTSICFPSHLTKLHSHLRLTKPVILHHGTAFPTTIIFMGSTGKGSLLQVKGVHLMPGTSYACQLRV